VNGTRVSFAGSLSTEGTRRLFSITTLDSAVMARPSMSTTPPPEPSLTTPQGQPTTPDTAADRQPSQDAVATASLRYFRSIERYLNDLQKPRRSNDLRDIALWMNNFARRIQRLPVR